MMLLSCYIVKVTLIPWVRPEPCIGILREARKWTRNHWGNRLYSCDIQWQRPFSYQALQSLKPSSSHSETLPTSGVFSSPIHKSPQHMALITFLFFGLKACRILVPWPGIEPRPSAVKAQSPNHWVTRNSPLGSFCLKAMGFLNTSQSWEWMFSHRPAYANAHKLILSEKVLICLLVSVFSWLALWNGALWNEGHRAGAPLP